MSDAVSTHSPSVIPYYPVMLDLRGRLVVVIGGGAIAEQKIGELLEAGARVRVISPTVTDALQVRVAIEDIELVRRTYQPGDLEGARLAIAATDDAAVNRAVWAESEERGVLLNAVDDVSHCHFIAPSVHRQGSITVTVSTAGDCPALAVRLRQRFAHFVRGEHAEFARLARTLRAEVARRVPPLAARRTLWYRIVDSPAIDEIRAGRPNEALALMKRFIAEAERAHETPGASYSESVPVVGAPVGSQAGSVALVGAGPGAPGLLTVRGAELVRRADVVVHDRLVGEQILAAIGPRARLIPVGKHGHGHSTTQDEINEILVREARAGHGVVRLKGGDPFVFGRGAEEGEYLRRAGISFEIVPGITSAIAVPAIAGIPVTHRTLASGFAVVTGHECGAQDDGAPESTLDWEALSRMPTLVVLMGLKALPRITARLLAHGASYDTPAAVIARGTLPDQQVVVGTLGTIATLAAEAELAQPATLIVGQVVAMRETLLGLAGAERELAHA